MCYKFMQRLFARPYGRVCTGKSTPKGVAPFHYIPPDTNPK